MTLLELHHQHHTLQCMQVMPSQALLSSAQEAVDMWQGLCHHPGLVCPRAALVSDEVGSRSALYVVHDHMPGEHCVQLQHSVLIFQGMLNRGTQQYVLRTCNIAALAEQLTGS